MSVLCVQGDESRAWAKRDKQQQQNKQPVQINLMV